jgi:hypothetical protein
MRKPFDNAVATVRGWAHPATGELLVSIRGLPNTVEYYKPNAGPVLSWELPSQVEAETPIEVVEVSLKAIEALEPSSEKVAVAEVNPFDGLVIVAATADEKTFTFQLTGIEGEPQKAQWTFEDGKPLNRKKGFGDAFERSFSAAGKYEVKVVLTYGDGTKEAATSVTVKA